MSAATQEALLRPGDPERLQQRIADYDTIREFVDVGPVRFLHMHPTSQLDLAFGRATTFLKRPHERDINVYGVIELTPEDCQTLDIMFEELKQGLKIHVNSPHSDYAPGGISASFFDLNRPTSQHAPMHEPLKPDGSQYAPTGVPPDYKGTDETIGVVARAIREKRVHPTPSNFNKALSSPQGFHLNLH